MWSANGTISIYAVGADRSLVTFWQDSAGSAFSGLGSLGGMIG